MKKSFFRFIFFETICILFFLLVHVTNPSVKEYTVAAVFGFVSGLILFISFTILFPPVRKSKKDGNFKQSNKNFERKANPENQRHFQDTDKIYIDK